MSPVLSHNYSPQCGCDQCDRYEADDESYEQEAIENVAHWYEKEKEVAQLVMDILEDVEAVQARVRRSVDAEKEKIRRREESMFEDYGDLL